MSQTIAEQLVKIAENEVKLYEKTFGKGYVQGREKGYKEGYDKAMSERKTEVALSVKISENGNHTFKPNDRETYSSVDVTVDVPDKNGSYADGYEKGKTDGYNEGLAVSKPEDLSDVLNEQEEKIATLSAILDKKASGGGNNNLKEYFEGTTTDLYWADLENLNNVFRQGSMTSINFPVLKDICVNAFYGCKSLKSININRVTRIQGYAFYNCTELTTMSFPESLLSLESSSFGNCTKLATVTFKSTPQSISSTAFSGCTNLTTINVPWSKGDVYHAPWGATNATIHYKGE
jgi:hypothetical protein